MRKERQEEGRRTLNSSILIVDQKSYHFRIPHPQNAGKNHKYVSSYLHRSHTCLPQYNLGGKSLLLGKKGRSKRQYTFVGVINVYCRPRVRSPR